MKLKNFLKLLTLCLLCATFVFSSCGSQKTNVGTVTVSVANNTNIDKKAQTIEIAWASLKRLGTINPSELVVTDLAANKEIPSQVIYNGQTDPRSIIFQTDAAANSSRKFSIKKGKPTDYPKQAFGRQATERFDDFAWENNLVAFRMYGEALEGNSGMAKGIDFWAKRTNKLIINEWYKLDNYHHDNGDGVDAYHVGMTLGAGDAEPIVDNEIIYPINYTSYKILDQGPIRISFELTYKPFLVDGKMVKETKTISLDAGSQLNKVTNHYDKHDLTIAAGVTTHSGDGKPKLDLDNNYVAYWDLGDAKVNGYIGVGVIVPAKSIQNIKTTDQHLLIISKLDKNNNLEYYQGGGWSKSGNFKDESAWFSYLKNFSQRLKQPLKVSVN
ncbi:DUF4861 domain-containing protein [Pedobacter sp. SD-b]|uniref:DUF4861 domain-containing protein n=1 Tax=Pedobacter segetis TaxID=2793069 RepID=A0ABS1BG71_9SPHI|nr:DUF4861 family protein [Pedobacter segetis]MBK0381786.1 DUF4861 domain-containing protein [Pedobacter segetis]